MTAVEEWVSGKDPDFFSSRLMALEHRRSKCIILKGNYVEKERWISTGNKLGWLLIDSPFRFHVNLKLTIRQSLAYLPGTFIVISALTI